MRSTVRISRKFEFCNTDDLQLHKYTVNLPKFVTNWLIKKRHWICIGLNSYTGRVCENFLLAIEFGSHLFFFSFFNLFIFFHFFQKFLFNYFFKCFCWWHTSATIYLLLLQNFDRSNSIYNFNKLQEMVKFLYIKLNLNF